MLSLVIYSQIIIAISIVIVWVFRFDNIIKEFKEYELPDLIRNIVGATKISLSTLLIVGIWYEEVVGYSALIMAFLMFCAQLAHIKVNNVWHKYIPSLLLLILSIFIVLVKFDIIN
jgi:hypothetical protein